MSDARRLVATLLPGQITGELALLDGGRRSADLRAGPEGATVMILHRDRLIALSDDDPSLGIRLIWNIATALALRLRLTNLQLQTSTKIITENLGPEYLDADKPAVTKLESEPIEIDVASDLLEDDPAEQSATVDTEQESIAQQRK
jgi:CRP-like cAMP-binding protein